MKRSAIKVGFVCCLAFSATQLVAAPSLKLGPGDVEVLYEFIDPGPGEFASPEGIAFDRQGNLFVSYRLTDRSTFYVNQVLKWSKSGEMSVLADLGPAGPGGFGVAGLTTDRNGNVYVAFVSFDSNHGIWKIAPSGAKERLAGSEQMLFPDGLAFDVHGNLYVTDYDPMLTGTGGVWRYGMKDHLFAHWASDPLLQSAGPDPLGNPMGGANGIIFGPPNHLYVANTQRNLIAHVTIQNDGSAGPVSVVAGGPPLLNPDGLAMDTHGNVYAVIPPSTFPQWFADLFNVPPLSPVIRVDPETGTAEPVVDLDFPDELYFDFPTSLAFGRGPWDQKSVYIVGIGGQNFGLPFGSGPKLTQVGVGIPGR